MANIFNSVLLEKPKHTTFDKSFKNKTTANIGTLFPIFYEEVVPGSHVTLNTSHFVRFMPMLAPIFDTVKFKQYYFFVPYRLLSKDWERFRTGGVSQDYSDFFQFDIPKIYHIYYDLDEISSTTLNDISKLLSYFNIPSNFISKYVSSSFDHSIALNALPIAAYFRVILDYFLDPQKDKSIISALDEIFYINPDNGLSDNYDVLKDGDFISHLVNVVGDNPDEFRYLFRKRYGHDYFTTATEEPQLGNAITLPFDPSSLTIQGAEGFFPQLSLGVGSGFVSPNDTIIPLDTNEDIMLRRTDSESAVNRGDLYADISGQLKSLLLRGSTDSSEIAWDDIAANLSISGVHDLFSINDLRNSFIMQELLERNNVAGYRYFEWIKAHFNVNSPDSSLQRSQFLVRTTSNINFVEVEQTSTETSEQDTPTGTLFGRGVGGDVNHIINQSFSEDGIVIGLGCFVPEHTYYQGMPRLFSRKTGLDYLTPIFERLGEQPIFNQELYYSDSSSDIEVFGYQSRYSDYKSRFNVQSGDFTNTLKFWTLAREFDNLPGLNSEFLQINYEDFDDAFAVQKTDSDKILIDMAFNLNHTLPLSQYSIPARL